MNAVTAVTASPDLDAAVAAVEHGAAAPYMITVPATRMPDGTLQPEFQVSQHLAAKGADGRATQAPDQAPWVDISYFDAVEACKAIGRNLLAERRALAIAINIAGVGANWTGGAVGAGRLKQGLRKGGVRSAQPANYAPPDADEGRWFVLSNGARICDYAGNAYSWVFDDVQGDERGLVAKPFELSSPSMAAVDFCCARDKGAGWIPAVGRDWTGYALVRGGYWCSEDHAGVFDLGDGWPDNADGDVGFRYTN